ncbi:apolipo A-I-like protein [Labeo rohita]|uniref:Apolipo A-I-like protein n=1 Tax=Labeo rohita TaxID=84645 RepID=A0A498LRB7_LABRO|nr:apolipo A-I-like protein [Labeo rohita]
MTLCLEKVKDYDFYADLFVWRLNISCQANLCYADEPKPLLEQLTNAFWSYFAQSADTDCKYAVTLKEQMLSQKTMKALAVLSLAFFTDINYTFPFHTRLTETLQSEDQMTKITKEAEVLRERLDKDLNIIKDKLEPYADNLKSQIQERMEELRTAMAPYADSLDSETLKATLLQKSEELQGNLEQSVKELQAQLEPYTADIKEKVDQYLKEMQKSFASSPEDLQANN